MLSPNPSPNPNPWDLLSDTERTTFRNALSRAEHALGEVRDAFEGQTDERLFDKPLAASLPRARQDLVRAFEHVCILMDLSNTASVAWLDQLKAQNPALDLTETHP